MAMDSEPLSEAIQKRLQENLLENPKFQLTDEDGNVTYMAHICKAIAEGVATEVINHIKTCAEATSQVTTTVAAGIPVSTTGTATAQVGTTTAPGTGTGTGTIAPGSIK